jgi:hypothetical protein
LGTREIGSQLDAHLHRSATMATHLDSAAPADAVRIATDGRPVGEIAREVVTATGWTRS